MLLTSDELCELTGAKSSDKQMGVLTKNRIPFIIRADNKIRTTWEAVNATLIGKRGGAEVVEQGKGFNLNGAK